MNNASKLHLRFYYFLFGILGLSFVSFLLSFFNDTLWNIYHNIYIFILLGYTWYTAILLLYSELKKEKYVRYYSEKIAVIMPVFNEEVHLFEQALRSISNASGRKEIFVINDGSNRGASNSQIKNLCNKYGARLHTFQTNRGKRHAIHFAVTELISDHKYTVTVDSDTILDKNALKRVVEPLKTAGVGASTGDVQLINENQNALTRMIGAYYWIGLNIYKRAQSSLGIVNCCSGCLAAYKTDLLKSNIEVFVEQTFLGEKCTHSEDRHLTNLVLKQGYKVKFNPLAVSYTLTPSTLSGFVKQQQRWKRGFIRESTFTLTYAWKAHKILFFQLLMCELTLPFMSFGLMLTIVLVLLSNPVEFLTIILPSWILCMSIRYVYIFKHNANKAPGLLLYMFLYEFILYWQFIFALFTVKNKSWITRQ